MTITSLFQIIIGFVGLVCIAIPFSQNRSSINYRHIFAAIILQIILAFALLKIPFIVQIFAYLSEVVTALQAATQEGAEFVFGYLSNSSTSPFESSGTGNSMIFAFQILPLIIVISSLSALLWFWNILPLIIRAISKIFEKLFNIGGPIGLGATANIIMGQLLFLESTNPKRDIQIYVNSPGGSVYAGLAIYDTMQYISSDVATICTGMAASMGAVLMSAGEAGKRTALPHSRIMIHQPLGGAQGQASDIEITYKEISKLKKELYDILSKHSGQPYDKIEADSDRDYWMTAQEAKEYGMIDEVLGRRKED